MNQPQRILQITDLHLFSDPETKLLNFNSYLSLQQVMTLVANDIGVKPPHLIALTGDISQDYSLGSYETAVKFFAKFSCPVLVTMGNHDYPPMFTKVFGDPTESNNKLFTLDNWLILFLDSYWPEHVGGQLAKDELDFLRNILVGSSSKHVLIFVHHQVLPIGSVWLDKLMLNNAKQLLEIIDQYSNIKAVICGHVHQDTMLTRNGVSYFSTPSTCWQFAFKSRDFKLDSSMPGYRTIDLYPDGTFKTQVIRIKYNDSFIPDLKSKGY